MSPSWGYPKKISENHEKPGQVLRNQRAISSRRQRSTKPGFGGKGRLFNRPRCQHKTDRFYPIQGLRFATPLATDSAPLGLSVIVSKKLKVKIQFKKAVSVSN
ncbi:MAG TPA: hypothetical protein VK957_02200 [Lunatimonas sp.]|nr:hypothetical protein [Lunatimonas sp.]